VPTKHPDGEKKFKRLSPQGGGQFFFDSIDNIANINLLRKVCSLQGKILSGLCLCLQ
jgi:hypothetical protein